MTGNLATLTEIARMCALVPKDFGNNLPSPINDFDYVQVFGSHTTAWVQVFFDRQSHPGFDYEIHICHVYPEHDAFQHTCVVVSDDEVHYCCLCDCKPSHQLIDGDDRKLMVVHKDMKFDDDAQDC